MGGLGSGRHWHWNTKNTVTDYRALDVRRWAREGLPFSARKELRPGSAKGRQNQSTAGLGLGPGGVPRGRPKRIHRKTC